MRTRSWRRYREEVMVKKRLKKYIRYGWYRFQDANKITVKNPLWFHSLGNQEHFFSKTITTPAWNSSYKYKYGKKGRNSYRNSRVDKNTRVYQKHFFKEILKENGIHLNISYEHIQDYTEQ